MKATSRRSFLAASAGTLAGTAVATIPIAAKSGTATDPMFALIEKHRAAVAACRDAREARDAMEEALLPGGFMKVENWPEFLREHPDYNATVDAQVASMQSEDDAFADVLRAVPSATPAGFLALARYACDLTCERDGYAVEGASEAYRVLAAVAGRPLFGRDVDVAELDSEDGEA